MTEHPVGPRSCRDDELSGGEGTCRRLDLDAFTGRTHTVHRRLVDDRRAPGPCQGYVYGVGLAGVHEASPLLVDAKHALIERELRETVHHLVCGEFLIWNACRRHRTGIMVDVSGLVLYGFQVEAACFEDQPYPGLVLYLGPGLVSMGRQVGVGLVVVGEADDARVVFRAALVVAEVELFEPEDLRAGLAGEPVYGSAPDAAATHDDVLESRLSCSVHARLPPRLICGAPSGLDCALRRLLLAHTVQLVAGLGNARSRTPLAFVGGRLAERPCHLPDVCSNRAATGTYIIVAEVAGPQ